MAKLISILLRAQIRMAKPLIKKGGIEASRKSQDNLGKWEAKALEDKVEFRARPFSRFRAAWAIPREARQTGAILYLHGGAYTAGTLEYARGFGGVLAHATHRSVLCAGYRLAPEHPFPAALEDALDAYLYLLSKMDAQHILLAGESAGGGLCYALALRLRELGHPLPAGIIALSPWTDLTCSSASYEENLRRDPTLYRDSLLESARCYGGMDLENPLISPVFGSFADFPPSLLFAGTYELLRDDAIRLADRLERAGSPCELHLAEGMWHVYVLFGVPEAREALARIETFAAELLGNTPFPGEDA